MIIITIWKDDSIFYLHIISPYIVYYVFFSLHQSSGTTDLFDDSTVVKAAVPQSPLAVDTANKPATEDPLR